MKDTNLIKSVRKDRGFIQIDNELLQNETLSFESKGLLCYVLSNSSNWVVHKSYIQKKFSIGRDKLNRIFKELEQNGYLVTIPVVRTETGQFKGVNYVFYEEPIKKHCLEQSEPLTEKPLTVNPSTANPQLTILNNNNTNNNKYVYKNINEVLEFDESKHIPQLSQGFKKFCDFVLTLEKVSQIKGQITIDNYRNLCDEYGKDKLWGSMRKLEDWMNDPNVPAGKKKKKSVYHLMKNTWLKNGYGT